MIEEDILFLRPHTLSWEEILSECRPCLFFSIHAFNDLHAFTFSCMQTCMDEPQQGASLYVLSEHLISIYWGPRFLRDLYESYPI